MGPGQAGPEVQVGGTAVGMRMIGPMPMAVAMFVGMGVLPLMHMGMVMDAAVGVNMGMAVGGRRRVAPVRVLVPRLVLVVMGVAMNRAIFMNMGMGMTLAFDPDLAGAAAANGTHRKFLLNPFRDRQHRPGPTIRSRFP